jgi:hypothetical protein
LLIGLSDVRAQESREKLNEKLITLKMVEQPVFDVFLRLIYKYDVPIGFEESTFDKDHDDYYFQPQVPPSEEKAKYFGNDSKTYAEDIKNHLISLDFTNARLETVLNSIVKQMKYYNWEINDGVVNIFPVKGRNRLFENLLSLQISNFYIKKGSEVERISFRIIFGLPEFKKFLDENNVETDGRVDDPWYYHRALTEDLSFSDLTFKELLNKITISKRGGWILRTCKHNKSVKVGKAAFEILI